MMQQLNEVLTAIERTAWQLRRISDEVVRKGGEARVWKERSARFSTTGFMLTRLAADYRLFGIYSAFLSRARAAEVLAKVHRRSAQRFYRVSAEQRGAFLKVGQMLSARPDLLPPVWIEALSGLQDDAPAEPFSQVRAIVEAELGAPISERFARFDETPLAAASIGQVHRARTLDGIEVAVKVQRLGIEPLIEHDLALLEVFLEGMAGMLPPADYPTISAEVRARVQGELDYLGEARAMAEMAAFFDGAPGVRVPRPIPALSGARVLTATFCEGEKITVALDRAMAGGDRALISEVLGNLLEVYLRQILEAGAFQADPHPGNFLVTASGELVLLDFGCTRALDAATRRGYLALVQAFIVSDRARLAELFAELGFRTESGRPDTLLAFAEAFLQSFRKAAASGAPFSWPSRAEVLAQAGALLEAAKRDPVTRLPPEFVMIGRVFGTLGGLFGHYRPEIDYPRRVLPHLFAGG
ncbi:MAG: ABC1 kinase family protein [Polyangia bacterium]